MLKRKYRKSHFSSAHERPKTTNKSHRMYDKSGGHSPKRRLPDIENTGDEG